MRIDVSVMVAELTRMQVAVWRQLGEPDGEIRRGILRAVRYAFAEPGPWRVRGPGGDAEGWNVERFVGSSFLDENYRSLLRHCGVDRSDPHLCESWLGIAEATLDEVLTPPGVPAADAR